MNLIKRNNDNTLDKIKLSLDDRNEVTLTPHQQFIKRRLIMADTFYYQHKSRKQTIAFMMVHAEEEGWERYSERTAERDFYNMMRLFGDYRKTDKEYKRMFLAEQLEERMRKMDNDDHYIKAIRVLKELYGLDKEEPELPQVDLDLPDVYLSDDISVLNIEPITNLEEKKNALLRKKRRNKNLAYTKILEEQAEDAVIEDDVD